jgi:hypothetical protein
VVISKSCAARESLRSIDVHCSMMKPLIDSFRISACSNVKGLAKHDIAFERGDSRSDW